MHDHQRSSVVDSEADSTYRWGGHAESLRRKRGDAAGVELGISPVDRFRGERGNCPRSPLRRASSPIGGRLIAGSWPSGRTEVP